jgi:uncharacterized protein YbbC (DUF1343 family)
VRFVPVSFTPQAPYPFAGRLCHGIQIIVTDRNVVDSPEMGLEIASGLHKLYNSQFELAKMDRLLLNRTVVEALVAGRDPQRIAETWAKDLEAFAATRKPYLLY